MDKDILINIFKDGRPLATPTHTHTFICVPQKVSKSGLDQKEGE